MALFKRLMLGLALLMSFSVVASAQSPNSRINLLVMSDDADPDTVPRNNRIFNRVQLQLSEYLNTRGFQVYDETSLALGITQTARVRRRDAELIEIARAVSTPVDAMVVYQIYASARRAVAADIRFPEIRIAGRVLNVRSGQFIAAFEVGGFQLPALPNPCSAECLLETVGTHSRLLAADLGAAIAQKLEGFARPAGGGSAAVGKDGIVLGGGAGGAAPVAASGEGCNSLPTDFMIQLRDFTATEVDRIEGEFVRWGCYRAHRATQMTSTSADFFYTTSADSARLTRNFRLMLELVGLNGQVNFSGNRVVVSKVATR
ncbi:hypothetical protein [Bosea sp. (in: a-proteobacteria)]|jgi:hypothetical protein|uniref:hypothetical protein n=1 Tax=Bosea sp. (in: a-proteobacteria) TaxID=1871050 RepID=UPI002DDD03BD|nr:hypothetical protein [Bosea sp. (in: a-proteobacteria)]HEV2512294.1 hypothetical protein [Bosea sp. (in: a-proteobacteria)]